MHRKILHENSTEISAKNVADLHVVAGNPARTIKKIPEPVDTTQTAPLTDGVEDAIADLAEKLEDTAKS